MIAIQLTGLSGAGKTSIANLACKKLKDFEIESQVLDAEELRKTISKDLGFSISDRKENIRRIADLAQKIAQSGIIPIIAAINPFDDLRDEVSSMFKICLIVWVDCDLQILQMRDSKDLYRRAFLPKTHSDHIDDLSGVNQTYEPPNHPDLVLKTNDGNFDSQANRLVNKILIIVKSGEDQD